MNNFRENRSGGALVHQYLQESAAELKNVHKGKLDPSKRRKINRGLAKRGFDGNTRFRSMSQAMSQAAGVLDEHGVEVDEPILADHFRQATGSAAFHVAHSNPDEPMAPTRIPNSMLSIQWTEMRSGFEVIAYMS